MTELEIRLKVAMKMVEKFKAERYSYLIVTIISFLVLIVLTIWAFAEHQIDFKRVGVLFLPTGAIALCAARILQIFHDCLNKVFRD